MPTIPKIDFLLMKMLRDSNRILPTTTKHDKSQKYAGAIVLDPKLGLHKNVVVIDFASLYPSCYTTFNISPETIYLEEEYNKLPEKIKKKCFLLEHEDEIGGPLKFYINGTNQGILSQAVQILYEERLKYKSLHKKKGLSGHQKQEYENLHETYKILLNASYGAFGNRFFRLFHLPVAEAVTCAARMMLLSGFEYIYRNYEDIEVVYGDSVVKDRYLTLLDDNNNIIQKTLEEIFNESAKLDIKNGKEYKFDVPYKTISISKNKEISFEKVKYIVRHKTKKNIYKIRSSKGLTIVTEDHSLINSDLKCCKFNEIDTLYSVKDKVKNFSKLCSKNKIDLWEYVKDIEPTRNGKILQKLFCDDNWIFFKTISPNKKYKYERKKILKFKRHFKDNELEELCSLIGFYIAEGSSSLKLDSTRYMFSLSNDNVPVLEKYKNFLNNFTEHSKISILKTENFDNTYAVRSGTKLLSTIFTHLCGKGSKNKKIPNFIFNLEKKFQMSFLKSIFFGDGSCSKIDKKKLEYCLINDKDFEFTIGTRYETTSFELSNNLSLLLSLVGLNYSLRERAEKNSFIFSFCYKNQDNLPIVENVEYNDYVYDIEVGSNHNFFDSFGFIGLHNTDSMFLTFKNAHSIEDVKQQAQQICEDYNKWLKTYYINSINPFIKKKDIPMKIDVDKVFKVLYISAKKRYIGIDEDGNSKYKGFELVRSDFFAGLKPMLLRLVNKILKDKMTYEDLEQSFEELFEYDLEKLSVNKRFSKPIEEYDVDTQAKKGALFANENLEEHITNIDEPYMFYIYADIEKLWENNEIKTREDLDYYCGLGAICLNDIGKINKKDYIELDYHTLFDKMILEKLRSFDKIDYVANLIDMFYIDQIEPIYLMRKEIRARILRKLRIKIKKEKG